jgi:ABC-type glutathione transport system ATPase component
MEKDQDATAQDTGSGASPVQEPTSAAVEEYLRLAEGSRHLNSDGTGTNENNVALFKDVCVWGVEAGLTYQESIASAATAPARLLYSLLSQKKASRKVILDGIDGFVREGEMLLVLGRPGSGVTTLLKTLAGITESFHGWSGVIEYLGISILDIKKSYRGDVVYNAEGMPPSLFSTEALGSWIDCAPRRRPLPLSYRLEHVGVRCRDKDSRT